MKTAIITGASTGIGLACAELFIQQGGFNLYNLSRRPCPLADVQHIPCDLSSPNDIAHACEELVPAAVQSSEVALIHNACQMIKDSADHCPSDQLNAIMATNVIAPNALNQALLPVMKKGSSVIYVGSTLSEKAVADAFSYVVSKHALAGMMKASCQDLMGRGIHTALVCPGFTDTEMLRTHLHNDTSVLEQVASLNSFHRLVEPEEIARLILWAHSNPVINGAILHANLGQKES